MKGASTKMHQRVNVTLPEATLRLIDRVARKGDRSRLIDEAVKHYVEDMGRKNLRTRLKEGYLANADRDREIAEEWLLLDQTPWDAKRR